MAATTQSFPDEMFELSAIAYEAASLPAAVRAIYERVSEFAAKLAPEFESDAENDAYWQAFHDEFERRERAKFADEGADG